ncbi:MAG: GNAT family N-acetyltransferase [Patescibacteria group bacterium]
MNVKIRKATIKDINQMYPVLLDMIKSEDRAIKASNRYLMRLRKKRTDFEASTKREFRREMEVKNSKYLVAIIDDKIVGYTRAEVKNNKNSFFQPVKTGYLQSLVVLKKYRGRGIAAKLYQELEKWLKSKKCTQVSLHVLKNNNAKKIYEKWGYESVFYKMTKKL